MIQLLTTERAICMLKDLLSGDRGITYTTRTLTERFDIKFDENYDRQRVLKDLKNWLEVEGRIL